MLLSLTLYVLQQISFSGPKPTSCHETSHNENALTTVCSKTVSITKHLFLIPYIKLKGQHLV